MRRWVLVAAIITADAYLLHDLSKTELERNLDEFVHLRKTRSQRVIETKEGAAALPEWFSLSRKLRQHGQEAIPELMDLARRRPHLTAACLSLIGDILLDQHEGLFQIPPGKKDYWVARHAG
jgi:hypothetical protein